MTRRAAQQRPAAPADPGLQPERTALAWQRTGLALTALALLVARSRPRADLPVLVLLAVAVGSSGLVLMLVALRRTTAADRNLRAWHRGSSYAEADLRAVDGRLPLLAAFGTTLLAILVGLLYIG